MKTQEEKKQEFIKKAVQKHGNKYNYDKVTYVDSKAKVCIICPEHGEFWQAPAAHVRGNECPVCANKKRSLFKKWDNEEFIKRAREVHGAKYNYDSVNYEGNNKKVKIICPEHGEFWQTPAAHIFLKSGCPKCAHKGLSKEEIIQEFKKVHGDKYDYSKSILDDFSKKVCIICPEHGEFWQTPTKHLRGQGCPKCGKKMSKEKQIFSNEDFIKKSNEIFQNKYDYSQTEYTGSHEDITIICPKHGPFIQKAYYHLAGHGCPHCGNIISNAETEIGEFLKSLTYKVILRDKTILDNKQELDIFIPEKSIAIEYDGLFWHSDVFKEKNYHLQKTEECNKKNIRLIHIFEDEWIDKKNIVKSMLKNILGVTERKFYARKCNVKEITSSEKKIFINENHIQGDATSSINLGLFYNNELVSVMTFGHPRINLGSKQPTKGNYELIRFCNKLNTSVVGGASKLFKYFIEKYKPQTITSYCDRRWSIGNMYKKLGFELDHFSTPNYFYIEGNNRKNRFKYRKSELIRKGYDKNKTEKEIMVERGLRRIYDCGTMVFKWKKE